MTQKQIQILIGFFCMLWCVIAYIVITMDFTGFTANITDKQKHPDAASFTGEINVGVPLVGTQEATEEEILEEEINEENMPEFKSVKLGGVILSESLYTKPKEPEEQTVTATGELIEDQSIGYEQTETEKEKIGQVELTDKDKNASLISGEVKIEENNVGADLVSAQEEAKTISINFYVDKREVSGNLFYVLNGRFNSSHVTQVSVLSCVSNHSTEYDSQWYTLSGFKEGKNTFSYNISEVYGNMCDIPYKVKLIENNNGKIKEIIGEYVLANK